MNSRKRSTACSSTILSVPRLRLTYLTHRANRRQDYGHRLSTPKGDATPLDREGNPLRASKKGKAFRCLHLNENAVRLLPPPVRSRGEHAEVVPVVAHKPFRRVTCRHNEPLDARDIPAGDDVLAGPRFSCRRLRRCMGIPCPVDSIPTFLVTLPYPPIVVPAASKNCG